MNQANRQPLISIITVTYNAETYLEQTIKSVINQTYENLEFIIVDGNSADQTKEIILEYSEQITCFISEPDDGIADAMNKGIDLSRGDFLIFLHADDYLRDQYSIEQAISFLDKKHSIYAFNIIFSEKSKATTRSSSWNFMQNLKSRILHQGAICRRDLFESIGHFDTRFKIAMDYDFFLRAYRNNIPVKIISNHTLSTMRSTGISSKTDSNSLADRFNEEKSVHKKNSSPLFWNTVYRLYWLAYPFYRNTIR